MAVEIAGYLGRTADVVKYKARADSLRASIDKLLWNATAGAGWTAGGAYTDGLSCQKMPSLTINTNVVTRTCASG